MVINTVEKVLKMVSIFVIVLSCAVIGLAVQITPLQKKIAQEKGKQRSDLTPHDHLEKFTNFITEYQKNYENHDEVRYRFGVFRENLKYAEQLNAMSTSATFGITKFSDLTRKEFMDIFTCVKHGVNGYGENLCQNMTDIPEVQVPDILDWNKKGLVTRVKNQGNCGSCWAFSVTGNVEGVVAKKTGKLTELSEQQLVDCSKTGCDGWMMIDAESLIMQQGGIESESSYPYISDNGKTQACKFNPSAVVAKISGCELWDVQNNEDGLKKVLVSRGPLSIGIVGTYLQVYKQGIIDSNACSEFKMMNHGVLLTGYGKDENGTLYWTVKNSWGTDWGENGYFRMQYGVNCLGFVGNESQIVTAVIA